MTSFMKSFFKKILQRNQLLYGINFMYLYDDIAYLCPDNCRVQISHIIEIKKNITMSNLTMTRMLQILDQ